jgi:hypothetical protein
MTHLTYYTIIGKDLDLIKAHIKNVKEYAGFNALTCEKEILIVQYHNKNTTSVEYEITEWLRTQPDVRVVHQHEDKDTFIENLYDGWNLGYYHSQNGLVFRGGSDQVFSKDSFPAMLKAYESIPEGEKITLQANSMECASKLAEIGCTSRHFAQDFGTTFEDFDYDRFESFIANINYKVPETLSIMQALHAWGKPTAFQSSLGVINRCDGLSWLMTKADWEKYGPMVPLTDGVTGDVTMHDKMQLDGYNMLIVRDCMSYHLIRGESTDEY